MFSRLLSLGCAIVAIWSASSGLDWRYVPFESPTAGFFLFGAGLSVMAGVFLYVRNMRALTSVVQRVVFHAVAVVVSLSLELCYWMFAQTDYAILTRQAIGTPFAAVLLVVGLVVLQQGPLQSNSAPPPFASLAHLASVTALGAGLFVLLLCLRQSTLGADGRYGGGYEMFQVMLFGVLAVTACAAFAASFLGRRKALG
jgi:uncharacterized protein YhhL (DUF1145 family)